MNSYNLALFLGGLCVGSFLGGITYRIPRNIQWQSGRSFCPKCKKTISWFDNIPLLSYFLLRGKCRNCHKRISLRYPLVELATAIGFIAIGPNAYLLIIFSFLVAIFVIDLEHQIIPDNLVFFLVLLVTGYWLLVTGYTDFFLRLAVGFFAALFLLLIHLVTRGRGMGLGDVKFAIFGGIFLGWPKTLGWMFLSFLIGGAVGVILILLGKARLKGKIAFGPFLIIGLICAFLLKKNFLLYLGY